MTSRKNKAAAKASAEAARGWTGDDAAPAVEPAPVCAPAESAFVATEGKTRDGRTLYKRVDLVPMNDKPGQTIYVEAPKQPKAAEPAPAAAPPDEPETYVEDEDGSTTQED